MSAVLYATRYGNLSAIQTLGEYRADFEAPNINVRPRLYIYITKFAAKMLSFTGGNTSAPGSTRRTR